MKHGTGLILKPEQDAYLERLLPPRDPLLREMEERAAREDVPISDPEVGRLLGILARITGAKRIVEVGTAIGYGALCLARGAPEAKVVTIDTDPERLATARGYLERAGVADRVELVQGPALEVLARLQLPFDLAYVDAVKKEYRRYLDLLVPLVRVGGLIAVDNLLWQGKVADPPAADENTDENADALRAFNTYLMMHPQLQSVVLPFGDGLGVAAKVKPTIMEQGGPY
ncbi:MAG TPA: O-methyltransferase [Thermoanaerobaculia bacterium]|jgi:predicted O-methyltransferase YrrM|nr:O-methyltransferase [Thermoanaerobaculia bacterium]